MKILDLTSFNYFELLRYGSITQAGTVLLGSDDSGKDVFVPMNDLVPMVNPDDIGDDTQ